ncbi:MAG: hypothetical protein WD396_07775 [Pseudohongiellaceae bacterium]
MQSRTQQSHLLTTLLLALVPVTAQGDAIDSARQEAVAAPFDIVNASVEIDGRSLVFDMAVAEAAGSSKPTPTGKLAGSNVFSYVWPTSIDPWEVGFERDTGILALAVTAHADFDDTPLYDENGDTDPGNDGDVWHSHWVVLAPDERCGEGALGVVDIPEGASPRLPATWPGLPILLDSPGWDPLISTNRVTVHVAFADIDSLGEASFDGVTAGLRVNESVHAPLLCVVDVFDVASGDLSLPGRIDR